MSDELWAVTSYFNPCRFRTKRANFDLFEAGLRSAGAKLLVIELAFDDQPFELETSAHVLPVRGSAVLWQKERMLNLAIASLPARCGKVAWLDCDLLFEDPRWIEHASAALDRFVVVQPFETAVRLPRGHLEHRGVGEAYESFASVHDRSPREAKHGVFAVHGHTGFAWAARREFLESCGLYDTCLTGSGDHLMAHAFAGSLRSRCIDGIIGTGSRHRRHFDQWAARAAAFVDGRIGAVEGRIFHLWHGDPAERRYHLRNQQFKAFDFDPATHLRISENGLWEWGEAPAGMPEWTGRMFVRRNEDGDMPVHERAASTGEASSPPA